MKRLLLISVLLLGLAVPAASQASQSVRVNDCGHLLFRPQTFNIFCVKHAAYLRHIQYDRWTSTTATGSATLSVRHAENGPYQTSPVTFTFSRPVSCRHVTGKLFSRLFYGGLHLKIGCDGAVNPIGA